jgi:YaiO family outer membrane protein
MSNRKPRITQQYTSRHGTTHSCLAGILFCLSPLALSEPVIQSTYLEAVTGKASGNNQEGNGLTLRGSATLGDNLAQAEIRRQSRFNQEGTQVTAQWMRPLSARQTLNLSVNAGDSVLFPIIGARTSLTHAWSDAARWRSTVGVNHQRMRQNIEQTSLLLEQSWYTPLGPVMQAGLLTGQSSPSHSSNWQRYVALSHNRPNQWQWSLRLENAREAFQATGPDTQLVDFRSQTRSLSIGAPLTPIDVIRFRLDIYSNPFYERKQIGLGWERIW